MKGNDHSKATPPPPKQEPKDETAAPSGTGDGDEGDEEEFDSEEAQTAYKAMIASLAQPAATAAAAPPGASTPSATPTPAAAPAPAPAPGDENFVYVDGDELVGSMLKSTNALLDQAVGPIRERTTRHNAALVELATQNRRMAKALAAQRVEIDTLKRTVKGGRRGFLDVHEPVRNGQPHEVTPEIWQQQREQIIAKSIMAMEKHPRIVGMHVPGLIDNALQRGLDLRQVLDPQVLACINNLKIEQA